jgi:hypothetical protein
MIIDGSADRLAGALYGCSAVIASEGERESARAAAGIAADSGIVVYLVRPSCRRAALADVCGRSVP